MCRTIMEEVYQCATHYEEDSFVTLYIFLKSDNSPDILEISDMDEMINDDLFICSEEDLMLYMNNKLEPI